MISPPRRLVLRVLSLAGVFTTLLSCGGRAPPSTLTESAPIDVVVSVAGMPVQGLVVDVVALDDATGQPSTRRVAGSVLASSAPTDSEGRTRLVVRDAQGVWPGGVLLRARPGDAGASYTDVLTREVAQVPHSFQFTTLVPEPFALWAPEGLQRPVTLLTTLADAHAQALAAGRHPDAPGPRRLADVLEDADARFTAHVNGKSAVGGGAWALRTTVPARMDGPHDKLHDAVYAALVDVALVQFAEQLEASTGQGDQSFSVFGLVQLLIEDLGADARFDGRGQSGMQLATNAADGVSPYPLDADTTRLKLAQALDAFVTSLGNRTGFTRADLDAGGVYRSLSEDRDAILYPPEAVPAGFRVADALDTVKPTLWVTEPVASAPDEPVYLGRPRLIAREDGSWEFILRGGWQDLGDDGAPGTGVREVVVFHGRAIVGRAPVSGLGIGTWSVPVKLREEGRYVLTVVGYDDGADAMGLPRRNVSDDVTVATIILDVTAPQVTRATEVGPPSPNHKQAGRVCPESGYVLSDPFKDSTSPPESMPITDACRRLGIGADPLSEPVHKLASTLLAEPDVTADELETSNRRNLPYVKVTGRLDARTFPAVRSLQDTAPLGEAVLRARCVEGCAPTDAAPTLHAMRSSYSEEGTASFVLPLSYETVPALRRVVSGSGLVRLRVEGLFTDRAGNSQLLESFDVLLVIEAPPLRIYDDTEYDAASSRFDDPGSVYQLSLEQGDYATFLDAGTSERARLRRLVVTNPWETDVAVALTDMGSDKPSFTFEEVWSSVKEHDAGVPSRVYDNESYRQKCADAENSPLYFPCPFGLAWPVDFRFSKTDDQVPSCVAGEALPGGAKQSDSDVSASVETKDVAAKAFMKSTRTTEGTPLLDSGLRIDEREAFIVPAGEQRVLYVTVPRNLRSGPSSMTLPPLERRSVRVLVPDGPVTTQDGIQTPWADYWGERLGPSEPSCLHETLGGELLKVSMSHYRGDRWWVRLTGLSFTAKWNFEVKVQALTPDKVPSGAPRRPYPSSTSGHPRSLQRVNVPLP